MAQMTYAELEVDARRLLGKTDPTKGGLDSAGYRKLINRAIGDLCVKGKALKSVFYLNTKADDKYVPLTREILWIEHLEYIPSVGRSIPMDLVDGPILPGMVGDPRYFWWTAVNVPDINGPSTRSIAIEPRTAIDTTGSLRCDAYQLAKDLVNDGDIPEIHELFHGAISARTALLALPQYKEKMHLEGYLRREWKEGIEDFKTFVRPSAKVPVRTHDTMGYEARLGRRAR